MVIACKTVELFNFFHWYSQRERTITTQVKLKQCGCRGTDHGDLNIYLWQQMTPLYSLLQIRPQVFYSTDFGISQTFWQAS